jgi:hypothetical protein
VVLKRLACATEYRRTRRRFKTFFAAMAFLSDMSNKSAFIFCLSKQQIPRSFRTVRKEPNLRQFTVRLSPAQIARIERGADALMQSPSETVRGLIDEKLNAYILEKMDERRRHYETTETPPAVVTNRAATPPVDDLKKSVPHDAQTGPASPTRPTRPTRPKKLR